MSEPDGVSLSRLNLIATGGLDCPRGGLHNVLEPELTICAGDGGGTVKCLKCGGEIELRPARELA